MVCKHSITNYTTSPWRRNRNISTAVGNVKAYFSTAVKLCCFFSDRTADGDGAPVERVNDVDNARVTSAAAADWSDARVCVTIRELLKEMTQS